MDLWISLVVKLVSVPFFIWAVSIVTRRWGPSIGGLVLAVPINSVIVLIFLALEHGSFFASESAKGSLMGLILTSTFCLVYSRLSLRLSWPTSLIGSLMAYFTVIILLEYMSAPLFLSLVGVVAFTVVVWRLMPASAALDVRVKQARWEIPARVVSATALVLLITGFATTLGPRVSGFLTPFPVYTIILVVFIHKSDGADSGVLLLRGLVIGSFSTAVFFFLFASLILPLGLLLTISLTSVTAIAMYSVLFNFLRKRMHPPDQMRSVF